MKIKAIKAEPNYDGIALTVTVPKDEYSAIEKILAIDDKSIGKYELTVEKRKKSRSLTANNYLWVLLGKIAAALKSTKEEIYRHYIENTSAFMISTIREDEMEYWQKCWSSKGIGWVSEPLAINSDGTVDMINYYGSSFYNTEEMAHLIDLVVQDCEELRIETIPPEELERLKNMWGA